MGLVVGLVPGSEYGVVVGSREEPVLGPVDRPFEGVLSWRLAWNAAAVILLGTCFGQYWVS